METPFNNAFILSGGGTRLMVYLGMFAALEKLNRKPDVLIATCGGAFAATVINAFPDNESRKEYLKSQDYFNFVTKVQLTTENKLSRIGLLSLRKIREKRNAPFIENVIGKYLAEMNQDLSSHFPYLEKISFSKEIPTLIIGSEILFDPKNIGQERNHRKLYQKVIFTDSMTARKIDLKKVGVSSENFVNSAVSANIKVKTDLSMLTSARISVSDMFYVAPVFLEDKYYAGGAIDLIPIELARHLAKTVIVEEKQSYTLVEEAFVRAVLGYSGNQRLAEIQCQKADFQIDTSHIKTELKGHYIKKTINWRKLEVSLSLPKSYGQFRKDMDRQWNYGFQQTMNCFPKRDID